ncbi:MAG: GTPase [Pseudomonadota bacterium]
MNLPAAFRAERHLNLDRLIRWTLTIGVLLLTLLALGTVLYLTESFFAVWDRLRQAPMPLFVTYMAALAVFLFVTLWVIWKLLGPRKGPRLGKREARPTEAGINTRLEKARDAGVTIDHVQSELNTLARRRQDDAVYVAFFGEVSGGKSSLIKALLGDEGQAIEVSVRGGSTRRVQEYQSAEHAGWVFSDVPGLNEVDAVLDDLALDEARRAHVVVYVCDSDLTRTEFDQISGLVTLEKPVVVVVNKSDLMQADEQTAVIQQIKTRLKALKSISTKYFSLHVVPASTATAQSVVRLLPDGREEQVERRTDANLTALVQAINSLVSRNPNRLDALRDSAVFALAATRLDEAEQTFREKEAEAMVQRYTQKAVVGALAAIAPGTDLLIQGVLATALVREMCALYDEPVRELDTQRFLDEAQQRVGKAVPVVLAVAGNALKAFPGLGTVAGGFTHAVAYGLIFDALGKSLAKTLADGKGFSAEAASANFEESLNHDLETRTKRIAKLVLAAQRKQSDD